MWTKLSPRSCAHHRISTDGVADVNACLACRFLNLLPLMMTTFWAGNDQQPDTTFGFGGPMVHALLSSRTLAGIHGAIHIRVGTAVC